MSLVRSAMTVGSLTLVSRVAGFVRDALTAAVLGAGPAADAFFVSFKLANLLRRLFAEGAFNAAFVPLFARTLEGEGEAEARRFAVNAFAIMTWVLLLVVLVAELFMPWLVRLLAAGFDPAEERFALAVELSRITFPYLMLISLTALVCGVLNALGRFAVAAFAPIVLNIVLIAALLLASLHPTGPAHALAWGVAVAGVVQLGMVLRASARYGYPFRPVRPKLTPRARRLFALVLPGAVGAGVYQINLVVDTWFASHLPQGAISYLYYADRLNQLPLGAIGVALGTALLPTLSRQLGAGQKAAAFHTQNRAIEFGLLLTLPAAAAFMVLASPIVRLLFERGAFDGGDAAATAGALVAFSTGLPAYVLIKILAPGFFAREDTKTPVVVAAFCLLLNVVLIAFLIGPLAHVGIALATASTNWVNALCLGVLLRRRGDFAPDARLKARLPRLFLATALMAGALYVLDRLTDGLPVALTLPFMIAAGGTLFFGACQLLGATDLGEIRGQLRRRRA
ncbi:MAG: murein biosynthesis integral membrane protein MurJ [Geminicoccaceae bacterium]|nr:murein biosynthesis integral membrane protein MurJ [Geminicoccaceae bacterium]